MSGMNAAYKAIVTTVTIVSAVYIATKSFYDSKRVSTKSKEIHDGDVVEIQLQDGGMVYWRSS